jgi:hypothetical protein
MGGALGGGREAAVGLDPVSGPAASSSVSMAHRSHSFPAYPDQLCGDQLPVLAQTVAIVDVFEAITAGRSYTASRSSAEALRVLRAEVELGWRRRDLVEAFAAAIQRGMPDLGATAPDAAVTRGMTRPIQR